MPNPYSLIQDPSVAQLPAAQRQQIVDGLEAFLRTRDLKLTAPKPEVTAADGSRILEGSVPLFNNLACKAQIYLQKDANWFIACFKPQGDWNFGQCFPGMQGMPLPGGGTDNPASPPANSARTFLLCNASLSNPLWVYTGINLPADKTALTTALTQLSFWKNWKETEKDKLLSELDGLGKQSSLYLWGNFPKMPDALNNALTTLSQQQQQTTLRAEVYRPAKSLAEQQKAGQVQTFVPGFPVLRLELPLATTNKLFGTPASGELDFVLSSPLYFQPGNSFIGLKGDVKLDIGDTNHLELSLELDYPLDGDIIRAIGKLKDSSKIPFASPSLLPNAKLPAAKNADSVELDLILQFSKASNKLKSVEFDLELEDWELFDNKLTLKDLRFAFQVYDPTGMKAVMATISASALLGKNKDIELSCGGAYPSGQLYLSLNSQGHSLQKVLPGLGLNVATNDIPDLTIDDLRVEYNIRTSHFYAGISLAGPWTIHWFTLENFQFHVAGGAGNLNLGLSASMKMDAIPMVLSAGYASSGSGPSKTSGWNFRGRASDIPVGHLITAISKELKTDVSLPEQIEALYIDYMELSFSNGAQTDFDFSIEFKYPKDGRKLDLTLDIKLSKTPPPPTAKPSNISKKSSGDYHVTVAGKMLVAGKEFDLDLDMLEENSISTSLLIAKANKVDINLKSLAGSLIDNEAVEAFIPSIIISPQYALIAGIKDTKQGTAPVSKSLIGLDLGLKVGLKGLPLVGKLLGDADFEVKDIQFLYAGDNLNETEVQELNKSSFLPAPLPSQPLDGISTDPAAAGSPAPPPNTSIVLAKGLGFKATILLGAFPPWQVNLPARRGSTPAKGRQSSAAQPASPNASGSATGSAPSQNGNGNAATPAPGGDATWIDIQQAVGPVQFNRIGFKYKNKMIWGYIDASLTLAGLTLSLDGLGVGNPINKFAPHFNLNGLGLDYSEGPLEIGGSFLRTSLTDKEGHRYDEYDGMAILKMEMFSLMAIGSYAKLDGYDSLFLYAVLNFPIGGPPFLYVTGLAAGFGYNRAIRVPPINQVGQFPLVNEAVGGAGATLPASNVPQTPQQAAAARRAILQTELTNLRTSIYPMKGQYFLAAGVHCTSFEMLDSFALLSVSFGQHFEIDVLGLSSMAVPTPDPNAAEVVPPLAEVQLALRAVFNPSQGILAIDALLTSNSYLFSRACHLTGGFAFYLWFSGQHAGDFVATLGGYHPRFVVPKHYPTVPRLGFNWQVSSNFSIKGGLYFALTPHALMAGGNLQALFHLGPIRAWFIAGANFIVSWQPYFYDANLYEEIGVSFTFWFFGSRTVTFGLGAKVHIWGPGFSGKASIRYYIVSFTISFGSGPGKPKPLKWEAFKSSFLPDDSKVLAANVTGGLIKEETLGNSKDKRYILDPKNIALTVNSQIPAKSFDLKLGDGTAAKGQLYFADTGHEVILPFTDKKTNYSSATPTADFGLAPMDVAKVDSSSLSITIKRDGADANTDFAFTPVLKRMPRAMWGDKLQAEVNDKQFIENALAGFEIRPAKPQKPGVTHRVLKTNLQYEVDKQEAAFDCPSLSSYRGSGQVGPDGLKNIASLASQRNGLLQGLGLDPNALNLNPPTGLDQIVVEKPLSATFA